MQRGWRRVWVFIYHVWRPAQSHLNIESWVGDFGGVASAWIGKYI